MVGIKQRPVLSGILLPLLIPLLSGVTATAAEEVRDWPCRAPMQTSISAEQIWGGPLPGELPVDWREDPAVRQVVEYAGSPENRPARGASRIMRFAEQIDGDRDAAQLAVYAGLLEETRTLRGFLIEGIRQYVLRAKILQESVHSHEAAIAALSDDSSAESLRQRKGYEQARSQDLRQLDDSMEEAEFLCGRYSYLDKKLRLLTEAIRETI